MIFLNNFFCPLLNLQIFSQLQNRFKVVVRSGLAFFFRSALLAAVKDGVFVGRPPNANGPHHAAAGRPAVPRKFVHMPAPQARRTMVGVARAQDFPPAVSADKIFFSFLKFQAHKKI
jgi:hypothetical protein